METLAAIVTAFALGAMEGIKPTAEQAVQDLYAGLKKLVHDRYHKAQASLDALEKKPDSAAKRESLQEDLHDCGAAEDAELLSQAQALLTAIEQHAPQTAQAIGVKLEDIKAANVRLHSILASGAQAAGVHIKGAEITGDLDISHVKAEASPPKK